MRTLLLVCALAAVAACAGPTAQVSTGDAGHARDVQAVDMDGQLHRVDEAFTAQRGAVLVFWQEWCASCIQEAPAVQRNSQALADSYAFYGVVSGPKDGAAEARLRSLVDELKLSYPQLRDVDGSLSQRYSVSSTPTILVFGADGQLEYRGSHLPADWEH